MARVQLTCSCGWVFFVSDAGSTTVSCPSCQQDVRVAGAVRRAAAKRAPAAEIAAEKNKQRKLVVLALCALAACVLLAGIVVLLMRGGRPPDQPNTDGSFSQYKEFTGQGGTLGGGSGSGTSSGAARKVDDRPIEPPRPVEPDIVDWESRRADAVYKLNIAGLTAHLARLRGQQETADKLDEMMMNYVQELEKSHEKMCEHLGGRPPMPGHMLPGDRITYFDGMNVEATPKKDQDARVSGWLRNKLGAGAMVQVAVRRDDMDAEVYMIFSKCPRELRTITKIVGEELRDSAFAAPAVKPSEPPKTRTPIPADLVKLAREKVLGLSPYYQLYLPAEDRVRFDELLKMGTADAPDVDWLRTRIVEITNAVEDETSSFRGQIEELEKKAKEPAGTDTVVLKNGTRIEGKIVERTETEIKIEKKSPIGKMVMPVRIEDVKEIQEGKGWASEFEAKHKEAKASAPMLVSLINWCKEKSLVPQKELACYTLLLKEPGHRLARRELGFQETAEGLFTREREVKRVGDKIVYERREYTIPEFEAHLKAKGYEKVDDQWCEKKSWSYRIDSLYADEKKLRLQGGCRIETRITQETQRAFDTNKKAWIPKTVNVEQGRFLCPTGGVSRSRAGGAVLVIQAPGPFLECRVKAVSELTINMGNVNVRVYTDDGRTQELYSLSMMGKIDDSFDVGNTVKGVPHFYIEAQMSGSYSSADNGTVMFLPSTKNSRGVLEVRGRVAAPLASINKLLQGATSAPVVPPGPIPPADDPEAVSTRVKEIADAVIGEYDKFSDAVVKIRNATKGIKYSQQVPFPQDMLILAKHVLDPTTFDPSKLKSDAALEFGGWWAGLTLENKRRFGHFYGMWCAQFWHAKAQNK